MYCFERLELSATYSLMLFMRLEISGENSLYVGNIRNENSLLLFILLKKIWLDLWFVTDPCKTSIEFPATISVSARPMSFTTMATFRELIVSMHLGSFTYSTFRSHRRKSFKLF